MMKTDHFSFVHIVRNYFSKLHIWDVYESCCWNIYHMGWVCYELCRWLLHENLSNLCKIIMVQVTGRIFFTPLLIEKFF